MSLTQKWKTTNRPSGPTGYKRKGTFRDISLRGLPPEMIDEIDANCIDRGINRSQFISEIDVVLEDGPKKEWYRYYVTGRMYSDAYDIFPLKNPKDYPFGYEDFFSREEKEKLNLENGS